ncbi:MULTISPECIES: hypothetical protein [Paraburkholderia]|uniref:Uncharacterized protein n=1 Tax=Paraburkholderia podalyriae TaxID=1938811 RepID=A0ABR7Q2K9_9BURK|nr:hypothetical protein [Paraburkholderia podalyriae]MBC8752733.1 hypothetical protein [Paraburkholderia podalyriae]
MITRRALLNTPGFKDIAIKQGYVLKLQDFAKLRDNMSGRICQVEAAGRDFWRRAGMTVTVAV